MKILKIELKNINSLKSEVPIVIDFENEQFKDVGLYAITGSTGAGKTTILDAITIALYHSVPRFNNSKGTLLDVVSHGATEAFSRVTFENEHIIYEAYWGIRLASTTGKKLKNPQEEVRLKNLLTGITLAELKRNVIEEVIKVTQLDYNQFLRSVMLAQGEFASFLSAKGPDKGKLLEQITGEVIYKKIGQGVLDRKSYEETVLKEIQSKINSEDILTEEIKIELSKKDQQLDIQIAASEKEIDSIQTIVNWYLKSQELTQQSEKLAHESLEIQDHFEFHKTEFELLDFNEKAEPFKEFILNFNRNEKTSIEKKAQLTELEAQLNLMKPEIERLTELTKKESTDLEIANNEFTAWQPTFDLITTLDGQLRNEAQSQQKATGKLIELNTQIKAFQDEKTELSKKLTETSNKIKTDEEFVNQNKFLTEVALEISNWATSFTTLKANKETLSENYLFIAQKKNDIESTTLELATNTVLLSKKVSEIELRDTEIKIIQEQLSKNNLANLLAEQKELTINESHWKQFKNFSEIIIKEEKELEKLATQKNVLSTEIEAVKKQSKEIQKQLTIQETAVADAEKIVDLEKSIAKYEEDRQHLQKGEPCGLCGSKEHPFAKNFTTKGVSSSELELKTRKDLLKKINDSKSELDKKEVLFSSKMESIIQQTIKIKDEVNIIYSKVTLLNIACEITHSTKIDSTLLLFSEKLNSLDEKIKVTQQLQVQKDKLSTTLNEENLLVATFKTKEATLNEKIKNTKAEIHIKEKSNNTLKALCDEQEKDLKAKLSIFNYEFPSILNSYLFIQEVEKQLAYYYKTQKNLDALKAAITVINTQLKNLERQLTAHNESLTEYKKTISTSETLVIQLKFERNSLLPLDIRVESKREDLQLILKRLTEKVEQRKKQLQKLLDLQREKEAIKVENNKEQLVLKNELSALQLSFEQQLKTSNFESLQDIKKALLNPEEKLQFAQNKKRIEEKQLRLQTLKDVNVKAIIDLNISKTFDTSEAESKLIFDEFKAKKDGLSAEKGELKEAFRKDQEIKDRNQEIYKKIHAQTAICNVWKELFKIIGNSKDAFNSYVQRLTLKHLLDLANVHLFKLNKRYSLKMEEQSGVREELNFNLIDHYQTDRARLVDTSSGGEKFIISLALALGLSDLASKNVKIDSLFIDEGFGTLDKNTLETVISTLETLQSQGKMIGIISHVENLKERIPTQIQITKKSNGVSVVAIL